MQHQSSYEGISAIHRIDNVFMIEGTTILLNMEPPYSLTLILARFSNLYSSGDTTFSIWIHIVFLYVPISLKAMSIPY